MTDTTGDLQPALARWAAPGSPEDRRARELLVGKYRKGNELDEWGRTSLPVVIECAATEGAHRRMSSM